MHGSNERHIRVKSPDQPTLAILLTSFNRRTSTLTCLGAVEAAVAGRCRYNVVLVDDGSTDGTTDAVSSAFPNVHIVRGPGNLYWNGGMRLAWRSAIPLDPDFFLWLNDDTVLRPNVIADLLARYRDSARPKTIVTGCTADPKTGEITYGGFCRDPGLSRLRLRKLAPDEQHCETMNGNCVLIPACAVADIGINSERYQHTLGDLDYGLRARRAGYEILELKTPVAIQGHNVEYYASISRLTLQNWRFILFHPKGIPLREWFHFCLTHGGPLWAVNFVLKYARIAKF